MSTTTQNYVQAALNRFEERCPGIDQELAHLYVLVALVKGAAATHEDVHNAWAVWRNLTMPPSQRAEVVPFAEAAKESRYQHQSAIHRAIVEVA